MDLKVVVFVFRCVCANCKTSKLEEALECRCCSEVGPAEATLSFDGSIERISCITQYEGYKALTHEVVLKQVGPLLRDSSGRPYKRRAGQSEKEYAFYISNIFIRANAALIKSISVSYHIQKLNNKKRN